MKIFMVSCIPDPNTLWKLVSAFRELGHQAEYWAPPHPKRYPYFPINRGLVEEFAKEANVIHFTWCDEGPSYAGVDLKPLLRGKKVLYHWHGTEVRRQRGRLQKRLYEAHPERPQLVSTPDLLDYVPWAEVLPQPITPLKPRKKPKRDFTLVTTIKRADYPDFLPLRDIKHSREIAEAVEKLQNKGLRVKLQVFGVPIISYSECTKKIAESDILVNWNKQRTLGLAGLEAMSMGVPVITELHPSYKKVYGEVPVLQCHNVEELADRLRKLVDVSYRDEVGLKGKEWVMKHHGHLNVAKRLLKVYKA